MTNCVCVSASSASFTFCCSSDNDLYRALQRSSATVRQASDQADALRSAPEGGAVLLLSDGPDGRLSISAADLEQAAERRLKLYVEYPEAFPGVTPSEPVQAVWERVVVAEGGIGELPAMAILSAHQVKYAGLDGLKPWLWMARVAGYDRAVYGLPSGAACILGETADGSALVAGVPFSRLVTARFAPSAGWKTVAERLIQWLAPDADLRLDIEPTVAPAFSRSAELPADAEKSALSAAVSWFYNSGLILRKQDQPEAVKLLRDGAESLPLPPTGPPEAGDGSCGILEGYASAIDLKGMQPRRLPLRADCNAEAAMVLAIYSQVASDVRSSGVASNLLDYVYFTSGMCGGGRADPAHPAFGLIGWGAEANAWIIGNYGDDNARTILATVAAGCSLSSGKWDRHVMRALLANLRTTGKLGFREDRVDVGPLEANGWKPFAEASNVNLSPHFESYLWACNLLAYRHTKHRPFLDLTENAIRMTMDAFGAGWRWNDTMERARMLLCLSWLVRVSNTPEHRQWLRTVVDDLLRNQQACGAIPEQLGGVGGGHYLVPTSNEMYGTGETPLIQSSEDPATDQLYTSGFALLGLHEAAEALGDHRIREAEDRLASYLCRIQVRSDANKWLNGTWFRAFDFSKWDYWASSADAGWGAWSLEAGWGQAWTSAVLAMRQKRTTLWDLTRTSRFGELFSSVQDEMAVNTGGPYAPQK